MTVDVVPIPVSVVIPCYRCGLTIGRAIASVLSQSAKPSEIILIEDFSNDGTLEILLALQRKYEQVVKVVALEKNVGAASARNAGWAVASQPFVAFLDADDTWNVHKLHIQYTYMTANTSVALCGHQCIHFDQLVHSSAALKLPVATNISLAGLLLKNAFSTPTVMVIRDLPFRFQPGKRHAEDFLLWLQIAAEGLSIVRIELPLAFVHKPFYGGGGLSGQIWQMERGELDNFFRLYRDRSISASACFLAVLFSVLKFVTRIVKLTLLNVRRAARSLKK
jgi:glycosyltransferase involved in cell wall biosynthesis